jgi:hypothetical protein
VGTGALFLAWIGYIISKLLMLFSKTLRKNSQKGEKATKNVILINDEYT